MVEVFKTNVRKKTQSKRILLALYEQFPYCEMNFDLEDRDKILRVEGKKILPEMIIAVLQENGHECEILMD
jgi:hypothetical protein